MTKKKKVMLLVIFVLLVGAVILGVSYAYWRLTYTAKTVNKIVSSCFSLELTNEKNSISLESAYPISDEKGKSLTPYTFTINNTCNLFASYTINLEMLDGTTLDSKYIKTMIYNEGIINLATLDTTDTSLEGAIESRILFRGTLGAGDSADYTFRIWMDSETPPTEDAMNKIFQGKITVTGEVATYSAVENGFTNLADVLLVNEYQTTSLDVAKNKISNKQEVDFSKTAPIIDWQSTVETSASEITVTKLDRDTVGNYGLTEQYANIVFGTTYTFNSETGTYTYTDGDFYNPETLDFSSTDYYMCGASALDSFIYTLDETCPTTHMYKIVSLNSVTDTTLSYSGQNIDVTEYVFSARKVTATELESDASDKGLYLTTDSDGDTYYYRGNVTNNYVKFADNYWQVLRINGDKSIRLLYAGTSLNSSSNIGLSYYNTNANNPTYVGYMYSNTLNSSYADTVSNDNDSNVKTTLDNWYKTNILDKGYSSYIADSGFCNDRSIYMGSGATSSQSTYYGAYARFVGNTPSYVCTNATNDLFTLNGNTKGNRKLTYPIGLVTADDLVYAGSVNGYVNKKVFTYSTDNYWTMTPLYYDSSYSTAFVFNTYEGGTVGYSTPVTEFGVRPVINLKADTEISGGIGTKNDPYIIK